MFILIDRIRKISWVSSSKKEIAKKSGYNYHSLVYYSRKGYYDNGKIIFTKSDILKSKQGGERIKDWPKHINQ